MKVEEIWREVANYEGEYEVSNMGRVRSLKFNKVRILKDGFNRDGYKQVILSKNGIYTHFYVHRLVWEAFNGPIPEGLVVNHKSEIKSDNRLENLEICTQRENCNYGKFSQKISRKLKRHPLFCKSVVLTNVSTSAKYYFSSLIEASLFFGYKKEDQVATNIWRAKKKGNNKVVISGELYYFSSPKSNASK